MSEEQSKSFAQEHKFLVMITASIVFAVALVVVSMRLYYTTGAAQLDLSRPGFTEIREQVSDQEDFDGFAATGEVNSAELSSFEKMYDEKLKDIEGVDAFAGDVLSPKALQINDTNNAE